MSYDLDQSLIYTAFKHNPRIVFVQGKPMSGRSLVCSKIVKEFGYTHISVSNLFKEEIRKASSFGDEVKLQLEKGELVPDKFVLWALLHAVQERKAPKYVIEGFPSTVAQAQAFAAMAKCDLFLHLSQSDEYIQDLPELKDPNLAESSEFNEEQFRKRLQTFHENESSICDQYQVAGCQRQIDAGGSQSEVFLKVKKALRPSITFVIGQPASGKTTLATYLNSCQNSAYIDAAKVKGTEDIDVVKNLAVEIDKVRVGTSVVVEGFPQNKEQAQLFSKNQQPPVKVVYLECAFSESLDHEHMKGPEHKRSIVVLEQKSKKLLANLDSIRNFQGKAGKFLEFDANCGLKDLHSQVLAKISPEVVLLVGPSALKTKQVEWCLQEQGVNFKVLNKSKLAAASADLGLSGLELDMAMLKRTLFNGDCVEELTSGQRKVFVLEDFFATVQEVQQFESKVAKLKKVVQLGTEALTLPQAEIAQHFQETGRLERAPKGENFEFNQNQQVRNDVAVLLVNEVLLPKQREQLSKECQEVVSFEETKAKIKELKDQDDNDEEKLVTDAEVQAKISKDSLAAKSNKVKLLCDLVTKDHDKLDDFINALGVIPQQFVCVSSGLKAHVFFTREVEEKPEFKEEDIGEEAERKEKAAEQEKTLELYAKKKVDKAASVIQFTCLDGDVSFRHTCAQLDQLYRAKVVILRNLDSTDQSVTSLLFAQQAMGFDLKGLDEASLAKELERIKKRIDQLRINAGTRLVLVKDPQPYNFDEDRTERTVVALKQAGIQAALGQLKAFITVDQNQRGSLEAAEKQSEEEAMQADVERMAALSQEQQQEAFDKVEETPADDGAAEDGAADAKKVKPRKELPRVTKPIGDVLTEFMKKDIGEANVQTFSTFDENEIAKIINKY